MVLTAAQTLAFAVHQPAAFKVVVSVAVGLVVLVAVAALVLVLVRNYERLARRSLERAYADLQIHRTPVPRDVSLVYHTYHGFLAWYTQTEHKVSLPVDDARELLSRLLRFNLTWGLLAKGGILVVPLAIWSYVEQSRSLTAQEAAIASNPQYLTATAIPKREQRRRRSLLQLSSGALAVLLAGLFAAGGVIGLATRQFESAAGGAVLAVLLVVVARQWLGSPRSGSR